MITDIEDLLNRAAAAPLGPVSLSYDRANDGWVLKVRFASRQITGLKATKDGETGGICLEYESPSGEACDLGAFLDSRSWVSSLAPTPAGNTILRIWLHGDGLQVNTLLSALADLTRLSPLAAVTDPVPPRVARPEEQAAEAPIEAELPAPIEATPEPVRPAPIPVAVPRPVGWQSFGAPPSAAPTKPEVAVQESEPPAMPTSAAEVSGGSSPAAESVITHAASDSTDAARLSSQSVPPLPTAEVEPPVLPKPAGTAGFCRECGSAFAPDHAFCTTCGARLN